MASYIAAGQFCGGLATGFICGLAVNGLGSFLSRKVFDNSELVGAAGGITANVFFVNKGVRPDPTPFAIGAKIGVVASNIIASSIKPILQDQRNNRSTRIFQIGTGLGFVAAELGWAFSGAPMAIVAGGVVSYATSYVLSQRQPVRA
jgi:hypothetical protein